MTNKKKFSGSFQDLQNKVALTGIAGEWKVLDKHRAENGAILNWWESTKTILFQGKKDPAL